MLQVKFQKHTQDWQFLLLFFLSTFGLLWVLKTWIMKVRRTKIVYTWSIRLQFTSVQSLSRVWLCDPTDCSMSGFPVHHELPEPVQIHVHRVGDAIQLSHPLSSPSPPAFNLFQNQGLFQWVSSLHQMAKVLELQLQYQSFQWIFRTDFP